MRSGQAARLSSNHHGLCTTKGALWVPDSQLLGNFFERFLKQSSVEEHGLRVHVHARHSLGVISNDHKNKRKKQSRITPTPRGMGLGALRSGDGAANSSPSHGSTTYTDV